MTGTEIAKQSVRGSLILFVGNFLSASVSAVAVILIARLLGPEQYGIFTLVLVVPGLLQLFVGLGVNFAVTRYSAYHISIGKPDEARRFTRNAISFLTLFGMALAIVNFLLAGPFSSLILHRPELTPYVQWASLLIVGGTILQASTAAAMGWNWMGLASLSQVVQSIVKLAVAPLLIIVGLSVYGAVAGYVAAPLVAGLLGTAILYTARLRGPSNATCRFVKDVKEMVGYGFPVFAGNLASGLTLYYVTIILAAIASNAAIGLYQAAVNFTTPFLLVSSAMASALFPAYASFDGKGGNIKLAYRYSTKYVAFFITPIIMFVAASSNLLIKIFYGASFLPSVPLLELLAVSFLPIALGYTVLPVFFNGFNRTRLTMYSYVIGALVLLVAAPLFSIQLNLGVDGLIYSLFVSYLATLVSGAILARKYMDVTLDVPSLAMILLVSVISAIVIALVPLIPFSNALSLILYFVVFFGIYLTLAPMTRAINKFDLDVLGMTLSQLRFVGKLVSPVLRYERLIISLSQRTQASQGA